MIDNRLSPGRRRAWGTLLGAAAFVLAPAAVRGAEAEAAPDAAAFFENEVRPLLVRSCQKCHGPKKQESGLRVDSRSALMKGGDGGPAVVPGNLEKGLLLAAVRHTADAPMPPGKKLPAAEIAVFEKWVAMGAPWPAETKTGGVRGGEITPAERAFWSFQPVRDHAPPAVKDSAWPATAIDRFLLARMESAGLRPVADADKRTFLRRATFDLTGLPPTPEEIHAFVNDDSPGAFARVLDRLLTSPRYGERWGRHWLDVVRYADTAGDGADYPVREAYKYRDYVIASFNADKPYDEFLREQIAGDILARQALERGDRDPAKYAERVTATGYLAIGKRFGYNLNNDFQHLDLADTLETLGRSVLGLSIGCARCHDHKYDPVNAADYYALYGILASSKFAFPGGEELKRPKQLVPLIPPDEVAAQEQRRREELAAVEAEIKRLADERKASAGDAKPKAGEPNAKARADAKAAAPVPPSPEAVARTKEIDAALKRLNDRKREIAEGERYPLAYGVTEGTPANARIQKRGEPDKPGPEVPRRFLEILGGDPLPAEAKGSGRLELAAWLTRPTNPLTARVIVNRVWHHHFGRGLVASVGDFGTRGEAPSHPELLDHLAFRFMAGGWSIKRLHREILLSRVYRLSSDAEPAASEKDPQNRLLSHQARRPLDAESLRDALLAIGGKLDLARPGPHPFPPVNTWGFTIHYPFHAVYDHNHRSVYLMVQRSRRHPYLSLFDGADPNISTSERQQTTTPIQALYLMNSPLVHEQSLALGLRLVGGVKDDAARVRLAFELCHGSDAGDAQVKRSLAFVDGYRRKLESAGVPADRRDAESFAALGRVLMTADALLYVD